jgi:hypothetical protein
MYGLFGGCSTAFHLFVRHPLAVGALSLLGLAGWLQSQPMGPGQRMGADAALARAEYTLLVHTPGLSDQIRGLRTVFDGMNIEPTEEQVHAVLRVTDACTDLDVRDVMKNPDLKKQAAWLYFLDAYARGRGDPAGRTAGLKKD